MIDLAFGQATSAGHRAVNEDALGIYAPRSRQESRSRGWLFAVADGVGGLEAGEVASARAVQVAVEGFAQSPEETSLASLLPRLVQHANAAVHDEGLRAGHRERGIATTLVLCALRNHVAHIAHVGDSRCYLIRQGTAHPLTTDHTWVNEQLRLGLISAAEAAESRSRHVLARTLGPERFVTADNNTAMLQPRDLLLLCTDGLSNALTSAQIARTLSQSDDPEALAQALIDQALAADASDNITALVIAIRAVETMSMYRGRPYTRSGA
uniref:Serine/threonine-protein phosphatase n=1 Tax=Acidobacterium capsulatum TaxID=33075 RepID=A0A7V4XQH1_9BACT